MGMCVIVYASPRERGQQKKTQTDEVWREKKEKSKNSA